jgi:hypothetical protein
MRQKVAERIERERERDKRRRETVRAAREPSLRVGFKVN